MVNIPWFKIAIIAVFFDKTINFMALGKATEDKVGEVKIKMYFCTPFLQRNQEEKDKEKNDITSSASIVLLLKYRRIQI